MSLALLFIYPVRITVKDFQWEIKLTHDLCTYAQICKGKQGL